METMHYPVSPRAPSQGHPCLRSSTAEFPFEDNLECNFQTLTSGFPWSLLPARAAADPGGEGPNGEPSKKQFSSPGLHFLSARNGNPEG